MKYYNHNEGYIDVDTGEKRILLHRLIYEKYYNVVLTHDDIIHHIDGNKKNNEIFNLIKMNRSDHAKLHLTGSEMKELTCVCCGKIYSITQRSYRSRLKIGQTVFVCSKKCVGLLNKKYLPTYGGIKKYKQNVIEGLENGLTGYAISKKYNMNSATVYNIIKRI